MNLSDPFCDEDNPRDTVIVHSDDEDIPVAVRYGWEDAPENCDLCNKEHLPPLSIVETEKVASRKPSTYCNGLQLPSKSTN